MKRSIYLTEADEGMSPTLLPGVGERPREKRKRNGRLQGRGRERGEGEGL